MEEIYANVDYDKPVDPRPSINHTGHKRSEKRIYGAVVVCLGLLNVFLLAGLISLGVHYNDFVRHSAAELSALKANLTVRLQASDDRLFFVSLERDQLNGNLTEMTKELNSLKAPCPAGWTLFRCTCYLLSEDSGSWDKARKDCKDRGADLVVIDSNEEQMFLSNFTEGETRAWIGLTDRVTENTWMWVDGTPLSLKYWKQGQPDNDGGELGEEDCAHIISGGKNPKNWNDLPCSVNHRWICEKKQD